MINKVSEKRVHPALRAAALELVDGRGTLTPGAPGDLVLWRAQSAAEIPYRLAAPIIQGVWKAGERVV